MFSKACEYAIRATIYIASSSSKGERIGVKDIAEAINSPEAFTAKILQQLSKNKIIQSVKGPTGGFEMSVEQTNTITLGDIVETIDNKLVYTGCGLGLGECNEENPCPLHFKFKDIRKQLKLLLDETTIVELANKFEVKHVILKT